MKYDMYKKKWCFQKAGNYRYSQKHINNEHNLRLQESPRTSNYRVEETYPSFLASSRSYKWINQFKNRSLYTSRLCQIIWNQLSNTGGSLYFPPAESIE